MNKPANLNKMTTTIKAFGIATFVIVVVLLQKYDKEMEAINKKFEFQKDSSFQVMSKIMIFSDSLKSNSKPQFISDEVTPEDKLILNFTTSN